MSTVLKSRVGEFDYYSDDFAARLATGETISSASLAAVSGLRFYKDSAKTQSIPTYTPTISGTQLRWYIDAALATAGETYDIVPIATTSLSRVLPGLCKLYIEDDDD